ncbi:DegQ family serine endoprotease [Desulfovibrio sp. OttesenSCG-928-C06]|nr:DegQ family serine endoprotease [Desulfovibrio sp. OttesenSCG-928-C06]
MKRYKFFKPLLLSLALTFVLSGVAQAAVSDISESVAETFKQLPNTVQGVLPRQDFRYLVKQCGPAVVNISTERTTTVRQMPFPFGGEMFRGHPFFEDDFFPPFGGGNGRQGQPMQRKQSSLGSGFIISDDGYIVTNNHVVEGADSIKVNFEGNRDGLEESYDAEVIGTDKQTDLALLKINTDKPLPYIKFGNSDAIEVGEWVVAIGNPFGLDHTVTAGILSAKFRNIGSNTLVRFLQTDASINPGNSGGPLINMAGEVIGINTAIAAQGQGIGFAIPSTLASEIINELKAGGRISRGWLGVSIQNVDAATAKALGLPKAAGALVGGVIPGQPAEKAGIEPGDVITKLDGKEIASSDELMRSIAAKKPGASVKAEVWRDGKPQTKTIKLAERETDQTAADKPGKNEKVDTASELGLQLRPLTEQEAGRLRLEGRTGLVILQLVPDKLAAKAGLQRGDVILAVGRKQVKTVEEFGKEVQAMSKKQGAVMLQVFRNGQQFIRSIEIGG